MRRFPGAAAPLALKAVSVMIEIKGISQRLVLFVATVSTDSAVVVATLPL